MANLEFHDDLGEGLTFGTLRTAEMEAIRPELAEFFQGLIAVARLEYADDAWRWFDENADKRILTVKKWFLSFTFRVKHCDILVRVIAGPRPEGD